MEREVIAEVPGLIRIEWDKAEECDVDVPGELVYEWYCERFEETWLPAIPRLRAKPGYVFRTIETQVTDNLKLVQIYTIPEADTPVITEAKP